MGHLKEDLSNFANLLGNTQQGDFYRAKADSAKEVKVELMEDVLTDEQIKKVRKLGIRMKECYRNAYLIAQALDCEYVEGQMSLFGIAIDHAFNKIGDRYFDATKEIALGETDEREYISIGAWKSNEVWRVIKRIGYYGDIYNHLYIEQLKSK